MGEDPYYGDRNPCYKEKSENFSESEIDITEGAIELDLVDRMHQTKRALYHDYKEVEDCIVKLKFGDDEEVRAVLEHAPESSDFEKTYSRGRTIGSFKVGKIVEGEIVFSDDFVLILFAPSDVPESFLEISYKPLSREQQEFIQYAYYEYQF